MRKSKLFCILIGLILIFPLSLSSQEDKHLHPAPYPQFSTLNLCLGDTATFINQTNGGVWYKWLLSSLDTITAITQKLDSATTNDYSYYFNTAGVYVLTLEADNGHLTSITRTLTINNVTKASFDFIHCANQFVNLSSCADQFFWNFGDGDTSSMALPAHMFADTGFYQIKLVSIKGTVKDSVLQIIHLDKLGYPNPTFTVALSGTTLTGSVLYPVEPYLNVTWNLGNGATTTGTSVVYLYPDSSATYYINVIMSNACGLAFKDTTIDYVSTVGIREHGSIGSLSLYPNPAIDYLTIRADGINNLSVIDLTGRVIISREVIGVTEEKVDMRLLEAGQYLIRVGTNKGVLYRKVTKL